MLTVTDVSTTCAAVIFRDKASCITSVDGTVLRLVIDLIDQLRQCFELSLIQLKVNRIETDFRNRCHPTLVRTHSTFTDVARPFCEHLNVRC